MIELRIIKKPDFSDVEGVIEKEARRLLNRIATVSTEDFMRKDIIRPRKKDPLATPRGSDARIRIQTKRLATAVKGQGNEYRDELTIGTDGVIVKRTVNVPYASRWESRFQFIQQAINQVKNE